MIHIERTKEAEYDLLRLVGEVDASNSVILDQSIQEVVQKGTTHLLIDGTELSYISSAGLGVFISYLDDFSERGIRFSIFGLNEQVAEVFHILGLNQLIPLVPDKTTALSRANES